MVSVMLWLVDAQLMEVLFLGFYGDIENTCEPSLNKDRKGSRGNNRLPPTVYDSLHPFHSLKLTTLMN